MSTDSSNVRVAGSGEISVGPTSVTAPTDTGAVPSGMAGLGFLSDAGTTETRTRTVESIKAWQNGATVRKVVTDAELTYTFTMIETTVETVELFYGTEVTQTSAHGSFVIVPANTGGRKSFVIDVIDGAELTRIWIPQGEVGETGNVVYVNGQPVGYEVTITTYEDPELGGNAEVFSTALKSAA